jgi:ABC-type antimicrobial peptide transport system permease subunit
MSVTIMLALVTGAKGFFLDQVEANGTMQQVAISQKADLDNFEEAGNGGSCTGKDCIILSGEIKTKVEALPNVVGVSRVLYAYNIETVSYNGGKAKRAERVEAHDANGIIKSVPVAGRDLSVEDKTGVVTVSTEYAKEFGFANNYEGLIGKEITLTTRTGYTGVGAEVAKPQEMQPGQQNNQRPEDMQPATTLSAKVVGVMASEDQPMINIPLEWAAAMNVNQRWEAENMGQNNCQANQPCQPSKPTYKLVSEDMTATQGYSSMIAKVNKSSNAASVATAIKGMGLGAADAKASIEEQLTIFNIIGLVLGAIGGIALIVAAIGVVNTMIMAILERTREIGVMRAVGSKKSTVRRLFTTEASMLGFMGGVIGVALGFGLTRIANIFVNDQLASNAITARDIITTPAWLVFTVIAIATLIGLLAGLGPAARAALLDPVEALRYE